MASLGPKTLTQSSRRVVACGGHMLGLLHAAAASPSSLLSATAAQRLATPAFPSAATPQRCVLPKQTVFLGPPLSVSAPPHSPLTGQLHPRMLAGSARLSPYSHATAPTAALPQRSRPRHAGGFQAFPTARHRLTVVNMTTLGTGPAATSSSIADADSSVIVVYVTVPDAAAGDKLSGLLVEHKLAACVNVLPGITSVYWWEGKVNKDAELLLIIKTRKELLAELTTFVKANHPYDECEVIALPVIGGSPSYLKWVMTSTRDAAKNGP